MSKTQIEKQRSKDREKFAESLKKHNQWASDFLQDLEYDKNGNPISPDQFVPPSEESVQTPPPDSKSGISSDGEKHQENGHP